MEADNSKKLEKEVATRTSEGFHRHTASLTSFTEDRHRKNTASVERITDYIVQRDNAYDQKLIKIALERDLSITKGRKDREEKMAFYNNERKVKNKEAHSM